jgi:cytochrome c oxidase cbb3-type subunit 3
MRATPSSIAVRLAIAGVAFLAVTSCERERRDFATNPTDSTTADPVRMSQVVPGGSEKYSQQINPSEDNAYALAEGKRLFSWYNCVGCHAQGGGGSGPALMDDVWIYGSAPVNVFASIVEGRPNGMPAFGERISERQAWELAAYVRSMSGLVSQQVAPNRSDSINAKQPESEVKRQPPVNVSTPGQ